MIVDKPMMIGCVDDVLDAELLRLDAAELRVGCTTVSGKPPVEPDAVLVVGTGRTGPCTGAEREEMCEEDSELELVSGE